MVPLRLVLLVIIFQIFDFQIQYTVFSFSISYGFAEFMYNNMPKKIILDIT
ncbi:hypothetical protein RhiirC2_805673 [Rhizophagus irregularis]|uniref:Uncharacterized protein n=1 Tax=Rhizophagus irregularis TaxID=588596 RepID=A0A2N1KHM9_9GLOM|nr:hypothetical protein RhiirC2_805673 [Rhizophagus irregularis]